ncbi:hypothetical protein IM40_03230 [Candidatus Paracaedimonas acanthamoebae]|nr:hypothetical protein IM40_03230 [Candidatus Paracaedimonas acanthamoebae]
MKKLVFISLACFLIGKEVSCWASDLMDVEKENYPANLQPQFASYIPQSFKAASTAVSTPSDIFEQASNSIQGIHEIIKGGYAEAKDNRLRRAYYAFKELAFPDDVWQAYAHQLKVDSWPAQTTWKERVGAHLFFPPQALEWFDCPYRSHLAKRFDILWGFAISAKFNHSLGKYLLVDTFHKIRWLGEVPQLTPFFKNYLGNVITELKQCLDHPDACYLLGRGQTGVYPWLVSRYDNTLSLSGYELFSRHPNHLRNKYYALNEIDDYDTYQKPPADVYLTLARQGYFPAYLEATKLTKDTQEREMILKEAAEKKYGPAFLDLGYLYDEQGKDEQSDFFFKQAAEEYGMAWGYIVLGTALVGDPRPYMKEWKKDLSDLPQEEANRLIEEAAAYFRKAAEAKDPDGWEYLISLWEGRFEAAKAKKDQDKMHIYWPKLVDAIQDGMQIGLAYAYRQAQIYFGKESFLKNVQAYGYPPQGDIRMNYVTPKTIPEMLISQSEVIEEFLTSEG